MVLTANEQTLVKRSFDSVGDIAILEIPLVLTKKQKEIGKQFLREHPFFKAVFKKGGGHGGKFRVQKLVHLAGEKRTITEHKESGLRMRVDVAKAYFSPRISTERLRIAQLVKPGEHVLVLFGGVGPYALVIAKHSKAAHIVSVELNPAGHKYAKENIALNKLTRVEAVKADAKRWLAAAVEKFDRIIMPLPMSAHLFLPDALRVAKKNAIIHYYAFAPEDNLSAPAEHVKAACKAKKRVCVVERVVKAGQSKPREFRVCLDVRVR